MTIEAAPYGTDRGLFGLGKRWCKLTLEVGSNIAVLKYVRSHFIDGSVYEIIAVAQDPDTVVIATSDGVSYDPQEILTGPEINKSCWKNHLHWTPDNKEAEDNTGQVGMGATINTLAALVHHMTGESGGDVHIPR